MAMISLTRFIDITILHNTSNDIVVQTSPWVR